MLGSAILLEAQAADSSRAFNSLTERGQQIDENLKLQIRRARHPGTPGTPAGVPNPFEIGTIENELSLWRVQVEKSLALPDEPKGPGDAYLPVEAKLSAINAYLNEATLFATLKIALAVPAHGKGASCTQDSNLRWPEWIDAHALRVPKSLAESIPGLGRLASNRLGDRFLPMTVDRGTDGHADPVKLKLSSNLVQGLELSHLADGINEDTNLTMIKYLATRTLLSSLRDLRYVKNNHALEIPQIPAALTSKLRSMCMSAAIADEQERSIAEPEARMSLLRSYASVEGRLPVFATDGLIRTLVDIIGQTDRARTEAQAPLARILLQAEKDTIGSTLEDEILASSIPFSAQSPQERVDSLGAALADARANTILQKIMALLANDTLPDLDAYQRHRIMDALDARKAAYQGQLRQSEGLEAIQAWQRAAAAMAQTELYSGQRSRLIESLLYHAPDAIETIDRAYSGQSVDPEILERAYGSEVLQLTASPTATDWFYKIRSAGSYSAARSRYAEIMSAQTSADVVAGGVVNPAKVREFIGHHDFTAPFAFTPNTDPRLAGRISQRAINGDIADLEALLQYGEWMGFHRVYMGQNPSVKEVLPDAGRADNYFKALDESTEGQYPVLGLKIRVVSPQGTEGAVRLADALAAMDPRHLSSEELLERAAPLVDQALQQIQDQILVNIQTVGKASSAEEIQKIVTSSMMISLVLHGFPEFHLYEDQFIEHLLSPSIVDQVMHRYVTPAMGYGMGALMLIQGVNWASKKLVKKAYPFTNVVAFGVESALASFMRAAVVMMIADEAYEVSRFVKERSGRQQQEDFFYCSAEGSCLVDFASLSEANAMYSSAKWSLLGRAAMDIAFLYFPLGKAFYTHLGDRVAMNELAADSAALATLGAKPGDFASVESRMKIARALREGRPVGPEIISPKAENGGAWVRVEGGKLQLGAAKVTIGGGDGWVRASDVTVFADLQGAVPRMTAEEWARFERDYRTLSAKISAGRVYRLPTVIDRMAIEDAFNTLDLKLKKPESWSKIEDARAFQERSAPTREQAIKVNRAARFLQTYQAEVPAVRDTAFVPASSDERKLIGTFKRGPNVEEFWTLWAAEQEAGLHLTVPGSESTRSIPPLKANGGSPR